MDEQIETFRAELVEFEALQHPFNEIHLPVELEWFLMGPINDGSIIEGAKTDRTFRLWHQRSINITRDRSVEHTAAARIGIGRDISTAPAEAEPQRRTSAHHSYLLKEIMPLRSHDRSGGVRVCPSISTGTDRPNNCKTIGAISIIRNPSTWRLPGRPELAGRNRKIPFSA